MVDPFLVRLIIGIGVFFFFNIVIEKFVTKAEAKKMFEFILLAACILYILFGAFLPRIG